MPAEQYFAAHPTSAHQRREILVDLRGDRFALWTDAGVFARKGLDRGTRLLIEALVIPPRARRLVDLGCGYGPIGLAMASMAPAAEVFLVDPNERACGIAAENAVRNGLTNITVLCGEGLARVPGNLDLVATNPPIRAGKRLIYGLLGEASARLDARGELWVVIGTSQGAKSLARELRALFLEVSEMEKGGGFRVYRARSQKRG